MVNKISRQEEFAEEQQTRRSIVMAQRQQVSADIHNADGIAVMDDTLVDVDNAPYLSKLQLAY